MHIDLCATAIIEASHLGNLRLKASEIAKIKRRSLRIIANDALGVDSSFGDSDITKGKAKGIKNPQRLSIGSSVRAVLRTRNGGAAGLAPRFEDSDDSDYDPDHQREIADSQREIAAVLQGSHHVSRSTLMIRIMIPISRPPHQPAAGGRAAGGQASRMQWDTTPGHPNSAWREVARLSVA